RVAALFAGRMPRVAAAAAAVALVAGVAAAIYSNGGSGGAPSSAPSAAAGPPSSAQAGSDEAGGAGSSGATGGSAAGPDMATGPVPLGDLGSVGTDAALRRVVADRVRATGAAGSTSSAGSAEGTGPSAPSSTAAGPAAPVPGAAHTPAQEAPPACGVPAEPSGVDYWATVRYQGSPAEVLVYLGPRRTTAGGRIYVVSYSCAVIRRLSLSG
ncbi:MAG TPA: hypothetical protein VFH45_06595, partial [Acidimicrobiales bacterium]|nr:hypothetical protein [Acidimicrobiales bacterium]